MFDIGSMELLLVAVVALVVVGPKDLPRLLRTVAGVVKKARDMAAEFKLGVHALAQEVEREFDPFTDLRREEGLRPGMTPEQITAQIMANREAEAKAAREKAAAEQASRQQDDSKSADTVSDGLQSLGGATSVSEAPSQSEGGEVSSSPQVGSAAQEVTSPGDDNVR